MRVYSDEAFSDWLLWRLPYLRGRVAYDARFEILTAHQLDQVVRLKSVSGLNWKRAARGYRLIVLDRARERDAVGAFEREPGRRVLYDRHGIVVILRSARSAS
jgi:hypothetical protein